MHWCTGFCVNIFSCLWHEYSRVQFMNHMGISVLILWDTFRLFATLTVALYIPSSNTWAIHILYILSGIRGIPYIFNHSDTDALLWICLNLSDSHRCWKSFRVLIYHLYLLFSEILFMFYCLILNWIFS